MSHEIESAFCVIRRLNVYMSHRNPVATRAQIVNTDRPVYISLQGDEFILYVRALHGLQDEDGRRLEKLLETSRLTEAMLRNVRDPYKAGGDFSY